MLTFLISGVSYLLDDHLCEWKRQNRASHAVAAVRSGPRHEQVFVKRQDKFPAWGLIQQLADSPSNQIPHVLPVLTAVTSTFENREKRLVKNQCYVTPFIQGETVEERLTAGTAAFKNPDLQWKLIVGVFRAYKEINKRGYWYADLCPKNIFMVPVSGSAQSCLFYLIDLDSAYPHSIFYGPEVSESISKVYLRYLSDSNGDALPYIPAIKRHGLPGPVANPLEWAAFAADVINCFQLVPKTGSNNGGVASAAVDRFYERTIAASVDLKQLKDAVLKLQDPAKAWVVAERLLARIRAYVRPAEVLLEELQSAIEADDDRRIAELWGDGTSYADLVPLHSHIRARSVIAQKRVACLDRFVAHHGQHPDDEAGLSRIWLQCPDMARCKAANVEVLSDGEVVLRRAVQVVRRLRGQTEFQKVVDAAADMRKTTGYFQKEGEEAILRAWDDPEFDLVASSFGRTSRVQERLKAARTRLGFLDILKRQEEETIAQAWNAVVDYGPAQPYREQAEVTAARVDLLNAFVSCFERTPNDDQALFGIWSRRNDLEHCLSARRPLTRLGNRTAIEVANRVKRRLDLTDLFERHLRGPFSEASEKEVLHLWSQHACELSDNIVVVDCKRGADAPGERLKGLIGRVTTARLRLQRFELLANAIVADNDQEIAEIWEDGRLLADYEPVRAFAPRIELASRRRVLLQEIEEACQQDPDNDERIWHLWAAEPTLATCTASSASIHSCPQYSFRQRAELAKARLDILAVVQRAMAAEPPNFDEVSRVWDEAKCRQHFAFNGLLSFVDKALRVMKEAVVLEAALDSDEDASICKAWNDDLWQSTPRIRAEFKRIQLAFQRNLLGASALEPSLCSIECQGDCLSVRWQWKESAIPLCVVAVRNDRLPKDPLDVEDARHSLEIPRELYQIQGAARVPLCGRVPFVSVWPAMRIAGTLLRGNIPLEIHRQITHKLRYRVKHHLLSRPALHIETTAETLPAMVVLAAVGYPPRVDDPAAVEICRISPVNGNSTTQLLPNPRGLFLKRAQVRLYVCESAQAVAYLVEHPSGKHAFFGGS